MSRRLISSGSEFESKIGYSRAVVDGDYVFVSGTTGYNYADMSISNDPVEQANQCFKNIQAALEERRVRYILDHDRVAGPWLEQLIDWPIVYEDDNLAVYGNVNDR